uniref:Uncharacterized protein n=1 Tax=Anser cygnoides TaxID=8845 RepID=A0A8B9D6L3_ANSCY
EGSGDDRLLSTGSKAALPCRDQGKLLSSQPAPLTPCNPSCNQDIQLLFIYSRGSQRRRGRAAPKMPIEMIKMRRTNAPLKLPCRPLTHTKPGQPAEGTYNTNLAGRFCSLPAPDLSAFGPSPSQSKLGVFVTLCHQHCSQENRLSKPPQDRRKGSSPRGSGHTALVSNPPPPSPAQLFGD